jgi:hypothetical protein
LSAVSGTEHIINMIFILYVIFPFAEGAINLIVYVPYVF